MILKLAFFFTSVSVCAFGTSASVPPTSGTTCPDVPFNGCSICGDGKCVGNPDAIFVTDDMGDITCGDLEQDGLAGNIDLPRCFLLELEIDICECHDGNGAPHEPLPSIFDIISDDGRFDILKVVLERTSLIDDLEGDSSLTVFAPSDDAFDKLYETHLDEILAGGNAIWERLLIYHVVPGLLARDQMQDGIVNNLNNDIMKIDVNKDEVEINSAAKVSEFDILARNGVLHVIDEVLVPPPNLYDLALKDDRLEVFITLIQQAGLTGALVAGNITIFAPSTLAFDEIDPVYDIDNLKNLLLYHVVESPFLRQDLKEGTLPTVQGENLLVDFEFDHIFDLWNYNIIINDSTVISADLFASNGIIHIIDKVLSIPESIPTNTPTDSPVTMQPTNEPTTKPSTQAPTSPGPDCGPGEYGCPDTPTRTKRPTYPPTHPPTSQAGCVPGEYGCPDTPNPTRRPTYPPTHPPTHPPTSQAGCVPGEYGCPDTPSPTRHPTYPPTKYPTPPPTSPSTNSPTTRPTLKQRDPTSTPTKQPVAPPTPEPSSIPSQPQACPEVLTGGCSVCGDGKCVGNADIIFEFPLQPPVPCGSLEEAGLAGQIPLSQCPFLPEVIADICECHDGSGVTPASPPPTQTVTNPPTPLPTPSPQNTPSAMPTVKPTQNPTFELTRPPTGAPSPSPTYEPTRLPTGAPSPSPTIEPTDSSSRGCQLVPDGGCSVCGDGKCVGNPDAIFEFPGQPAVACKLLETAGLGGAINLGQCVFLPDLINDICECQ